MVLVVVKYNFIDSPFFEREKKTHFSNECFSFFDHRQRQTFLKGIFKHSSDTGCVNEFFLSSIKDKNSESKKRSLIHSFPLQTY